MKIREELILVCGGRENLDIQMMGFDVHQIFGASTRSEKPYLGASTPRITMAEKVSMENKIMVFRFEGDEHIGHDYIESLPIGFWIDAKKLKKADFSEVFVWEDL